MMKIVVSLACVLATAPVPALSAAPNPESPGNIAACIVDNDLKDVRALLSTLPGSPEERRIGAKIMAFYGGCNDNRVASGQIGWRERAEIANAALMWRLGGAKFDAASPTRNGWRLAVAGKTAGADYDASAVSMRQFGDCVVAVAPAAALRLAQSPHDGPEEAAAITVLVPTLNDCIAPGQNLKVKRADLRLIVAEPLYHLVSK